MQLVRNWFNKITIERIQLELMNTAYGSGHASLSRLDPRCMLIWYLFFAIAPWFISSINVLAGLFLMMVVTTVLSRVTPFIIVVLCLGLIGQVGLAVYCVPLFRWGHQFRAATAEADLKAVGCIACEHYGLLRHGSRENQRRPACARHACRLLVQLVIRLSDTPRIIRRIPQCNALLPIAGKSAGTPGFSLLAARSLLYKAAGAILLPLDAGNC